MNNDTLRRAAAAMRERAEAATQGPWRQQPIEGPGRPRADVRGLPENTTYDHRGDAVATAEDSSFGACLTTDAEHIASWHPAVALAVADWLDEAADEAESFGHSDAPAPHAIAVANAYLNAAGSDERICSHQEVEVFRTVPPHAKCKGCGQRVKRTWELA